MEKMPAIKAIECKAEIESELNFVTVIAENHCCSQNVEAFFKKLFKAIISIKDRGLS